MESPAGDFGRRVGVGEGLTNTPEERERSDPALTRAASVAADFGRGVGTGVGVATFAEREIWL